MNENHDFLFQIGSKKLPVCTNFPKRFLFKKSYVGAHFFSSIGVSPERQGGGGLGFDHF